MQLPAHTNRNFHTVHPPPTTHPPLILAIIYHPQAYLLILRVER